MSFQIKNSLAVQFTKAPIIAIAGPSGSGKTESAMRLMRGFIGPTEKFVIVDTEEKRALYKKARYQPWDWLDFQPPFTPERYVEVLEAVKGYAGVILDSGSHEYAGPGGLQDIHEETLHRMARGNESRFEALSGPAWKDAKQRHKTKFMSYLIRYPTPLVICLRAEPKVKFVKVMKDGKEVNSIVDAGYQPICEKSFMFEMLVGAMMTADNAGVPQHIKRLETDLEPVFLAGKQIDEATGQRLAEWSAGRDPAPKESPKEPPPKPPVLFTKPEMEDMVKTFEVKTVKELQVCFEAAFKAAKRKKDREAMTFFTASYNTRKAEIESQQA